MLDRHEVLDIRIEDGRVAAVVTDHGEIARRHRGLLRRHLGSEGRTRWSASTLPLTPLAHQLAWTVPLPELVGTSVEATRPILRHQDADLYYRERGDRLGIGYYGHRPMPIDADDIVSVADAEVMPSVLTFTPDDFAPGWADAAALLPALRDATIDEAINGLFSFTTDNVPLLGETTTRGFWVAEAVWVTHSAGVGTGHVASGSSTATARSFDLHECDVNRFERHQLSPEYVQAQGLPELRRGVRHPAPAGAHARTPPDAYVAVLSSPSRARRLLPGGERLGASAVVRGERRAARRLPVRDTERRGPRGTGRRSSALRRRRPGNASRMYDMTALKRLAVSGPGATAFLQWMCTGNVDKSVGSVTYCLLLDVDGGIRSDVTVARLGPDRYQVGVNGNLDLDWFTRHAPGDVTVRDITAGTCCIGVWGPRARELVQPLTVDDFSNDALRYFRAHETYLGTSPVTALRLSYVGELGWELYTTRRLRPQALWDTLWAAGRPLRHHRRRPRCVQRLRLEKGYRSFGTDMTYEHDPYEAGLGFAVKLDKGDFLGREALVKRGERRRGG